MYNSSRILNLFILIFLYFLLLTSIVFSQNKIFDLKWTIMSESGGVVTGSKYNLFETFGFPMFGLMSSSNYILSGGSSFPTNVNGYLKEKIIPKNFTLQQNYPNPFNPTTNIQFELPKTAHVELVIYNLLGQKLKTLANKEFEAGFHYIAWDGTSEKGTLAGSGTYLFIIQVKSGNKILFQESKKMSFLK